MAYFLQIAQKLQHDPQNNQLIQYESLDFNDEPIRVSCDEIMKILDEFVGHNLKKVGITENTTNKDTLIQKGQNFQDKNEKGNQNNENSIKSSESSSTPTSTPLKPVSQEAFICEIKELDEQSLNKLADSLLEDLQKNLSQMASNNFFSEKNSLYASKSKEILELRKYFSQCKEKIYKNAYLYVTKG